ncbi:predicted protein [Naegleria gruberi]|uniref:Predicted protein n=1 Tax=Naegleria gruberi TaxID=5762 RepID=D2V6A7_NAEGR|nr:uncharacterized protein NAEGRDRAFT_64367 [Naegleria gruberi]EFC47539.1 predicted protein [Naegleria gruberi]|eukprot:XP_002680283.1 predicted protein [Naegleria gruberi strain NEG-M]
MVQVIVPVTHDDMEEVMSNDTSKNPEENVSTFYRVCGGRIPINLFIISVVSILLIMSCFCIWIASFTVTKQVIEGLSNDLIDVNGEKITSYLNTFMDPLGKLSKSIAYDYNNGIATTSNFRTYLFPKFAEFKTSSCGYFFAGPPSTKYTYSTAGSGNKTYPVYSYQPPGFIGTLRDTINVTTGVVTKYNSTVDLTPFYTLDQDYYNSTIILSTQLGIEGVYGNAYKPYGSSMAIYHSSKLYDPVQYKTGKKVVTGVTRVNISLQNIVDFLSKIVLIGKGFCLVSQQNGILVGGSINTLTPDGNTNLHIYNLTERDAGQLMKEISVKYGDLNELPKRITETVNGIGYIISHYTYKIDNLKWNVYFVVYQEEVIASLTMTTGISVGVAVTVMIIGVIVSFIIGFIVSKPMKALERQFELIKVLDLDTVNIGNSVFKEINSIFGNLKTTVQWLKEIKSFIPEHVFEQLINSQTIEMEFGSVNIKKNESFAESKHSMGTTNDGVSHADLESRIHSSKKGGGSLFQMGLSVKQTVVITCQLKGFFSMEQPSDIENGFKKIMNAIGPITKVYKANLQVLPKFALQLALSANSPGEQDKLIEKSVELAFKLAKAINQVGPDFYPRIGVSCSKARVGNLGTKTSRYYTIVGACVVDSEKLCILADSFNVNVLIDTSCCESLQADIARKFILKPIDKIKKEMNNSSIETIYEVFGEKNTDNDEWLYELENSKKNNAFAEYYKAFDVFSADFWNGISQSEIKKEIDHVLGVFQNYLVRHPEDITTERLISILQPCLNISKMEENSIPIILSSYYSSFDCSYAAFTNVGDVRALPLDI